MRFRGRFLLALIARMCFSPDVAPCGLFCLLFDAVLVELCSLGSRAAPTGASPTTASQQRALPEGSTPLHSLHSLVAILSGRAVAPSSHA
jgi:hypothetical protein